MRLAISISTLVSLLILGAGVFCSGPWYGTPPLSTLLSTLKPLGLLAGAVLAGLVASRMRGQSEMTSAWAVFAVGLGLQAVGQGTIASYQIFLQQELPFPSWGDAFFVASLGLMLYALFSFSLRSYRSGLSLGSRWRFWWPAPVFGGAALVICLVTVLPTLKAEDGWMKVGLNAIYPFYSVLALVPAAVMLRMALRFRGGRLLLVWLPLTVGLVATLAADVLYAWLTGMEAGWAFPLVDWLYLSAYLLMPTGILFQLSLLGRPQA